MTDEELREACVRLLGRAHALLCPNTSTPSGVTWDDQALAWCDDYVEIEDALHPSRA